MKSIRIRVFRGQKITLNEDGTVQNENWEIKLNEIEFVKYLEYVKVQGFCKVTVENVFEIKTNSDGKISALEVPKELKDEYRDMLVKAFNPVEEKKEDLTGLMRRIEALERENKSLREYKEDPVSESTNKPLLNYTRDELMELAASLGLVINDSVPRTHIMKAITEERKKLK
jgi:hypothetical protein